MLKVLLSPIGRIRRDQFWYAWLFVLILGIGSYQARQNIGGLIGGIITIYLTITIFGKRKHDFDASVWGLLLPYGLTIACYAVVIWLALQMRDMMFRPGVTYNDTNLMTNLIIVVSLVPLLIWLIQSLSTGLQKGTSGDNRYGPDPRKAKKIAVKPGRGMRVDARR